MVARFVGFNAGYAGSGVQKLVNTSAALGDLTGNFTNASLYFANSSVSWSYAPRNVSGGGVFLTPGAAVFVPRVPLNYPGVSFHFWVFLRGDVAQASRLLYMNDTGVNPASTAVGNQLGIAIQQDLGGAFSVIVRWPQCKPRGSGDARNLFANQLAAMRSQAFYNGLLRFTRGWHSIIVAFPPSRTAATVYVDGMKFSTTNTFESCNSYWPDVFDGSMWVGNAPAEYAISSPIASPFAPRPGNTTAASPVLPDSATHVLGDFTIYNGVVAPWDPRVVVPSVSSLIPSTGAPFVFADTMALTGSGNFSGVGTFSTAGGAFAGAGTIAGAGTFSGSGTFTGTIDAPNERIVVSAGTAGRDAGILNITCVGFAKAPQATAANYEVESAELCADLSRTEIIVVHNDTDFPFTCFSELAAAVTRVREDVDADVDSVLFDFAHEAYSTVRFQVANGTDVSDAVCFYAGAMPGPAGEENGYSAPVPEAFRGGFYGKEYPKTPLGLVRDGFPTMPACDMALFALPSGRRVLCYLGVFIGPYTNLPIRDAVTFSGAGTFVGGDIAMSGNGIFTGNGTMDTARLNSTFVGRGAATNANGSMTAFPAFVNATSLPPSVPVAPVPSRSPSRASALASWFTGGYIWNLFNFTFAQTANYVAPPPPPRFVATTAAPLTACTANPPDHRYGAGNALPVVDMTAIDTMRNGWDAQLVVPNGTYNANFLSFAPTGNATALDLQWQDFTAFQNGLSIVIMPNSTVCSGTVFNIAGFVGFFVRGPNVAYVGNTCVGIVNRDSLGNPAPPYAPLKSGDVYFYIQTPSGGLSGATGLGSDVVPVLPFQPNAYTVVTFHKGVNVYHNGRPWAFYPLNNWAQTNYFTNVIYGWNTIWDVQLYNRALNYTEVTAISMGMSNAC